MIFPKITFDKASKIDAKMSPNVDIIKPNRNINFIGISKILQSGFTVGSLLGSYESSYDYYS